jgi:flagellar basal body-associated protein FliL
MDLLVPIVSFLVVAIAGVTIGVVFWFVLREKHEHSEHYIPEAPGTTAAHSDSTPE